MVVGRDGYPRGRPIRRAYILRNFPVKDQEDRRRPLSGYVLLEGEQGRAQIQLRASTTTTTEASSEIEDQKGALRRLQWTVGEVQEQRPSKHRRQRATHHHNHSGNYLIDQSSDLTRRPPELSKTPPRETNEAPALMIVSK